jgi:hypothetical protein
MLPKCRCFAGKAEIAETAGFVAVQDLTRAVDVGSRFGLSALAPIEIAIYTRVRDPSMKEAIRIFGASLRAASAT